MPLSPFVVEGFGGLNLVADPEEVGAVQSVDNLNVELKPGGFKTRDGWSALGSAFTISPTAMAYYKSTAGDEFIVATTNTGVTSPYNLATNTAGTTVATESLGRNNGMVAFGGTTGIFLYLADTSNNLRRFNGSTWNSAAIGSAISGAQYLAVTANDNRLVAASDQRVAFSDPGLPETFGVNNWVDLHPGDGQYISALVTWRDYTFAFKQNKFFVFYGTSTDNDGEPIFNYRAVATGHGIIGGAGYAGSSGGAAVAGEEGVYFADRFGIYLTAGDSPRCISRALEPYLDGTIVNGPSPSFSLAVAPVLAYYDRKLYVTDTTNRTTLVYDPQLDAWAIWQIGATGMTSVPEHSTYTSVYFGENGTKKLAKVTGTTDNGFAVSWSYTSGLYDLSGENRVAVTFKSAVWGTGAATLQVANDHGAFDTGSSVTLGTSPAVTQGVQRIDRRGTYWQHKFSGSGVVVVNRLAHYVRFIKPAGRQ